MARTSSALIVHRLMGADSVAAVVTIARNFLSEWNRAESARLPENCRPDDIRNAEDVAWWADTFGTEYASGELVSPQLQEMYDVFQCAAGRLREIEGGK
jgi:hypothetical protein